MHRRHSMPFGASCCEQGIKFRLWAPAALKVDVHLQRSEGPLRLPMERSLSDWYELTTDIAVVGDRYFFQIDGSRNVPDPASRYQPQDVHGPSEVIDPSKFYWKETNWQGRPWEEAVIYELHVGSFTEAGTFSSAIERFDYLADLGVTAIELMPVADFPGLRNWGYDGVLPFAPDNTYGKPEDLKAMIEAAHDRGLMVLLDVVYNHFGPEGNYLSVYAPQFFTDRHHTPWGDGINFDGAESRTVRDFFIHNALYWLNEYCFDGLRLDAVHAIADDSVPHILTELADVVRANGAPGRHIHLVLENDRNQSRYLERTKPCIPRSYTAQWNDDFHHSMHVAITEERDGYYVDYADRSIDHLARCLTQGFAYQGEPSTLRKGAVRGESTNALPPAAFVSFLQNHDQIGNRAFGDRLVAFANHRALTAATAILLLCPSPPLLFMGEEFGASTPFLFFCNFEGDLAKAVSEGRRNEFSHFPLFKDPMQRERIPDPNAIQTFEASRLDWNSMSLPTHLAWRELYQTLLTLRTEHILPLISCCAIPETGYDLVGASGLSAHWQFPNQSRLELLANLGEKPVSGFAPPVSKSIYASDGVTDAALRDGTLPPWSVAWVVEP